MKTELLVYLLQRVGITASLFFLFAAMALGQAAIPVAVAEALSQDIPQTVIVQFKDDDVEVAAQATTARRKLKFFDAAVLAQLRTEYAVIKTRAMRGLPAGIRKKMDYANLPMTALIVSDANALQQLIARPDVVAVFENVPHHAMLAESLPMINADVIKTLDKKGAGTTVAVLDSGVDFGLPAFGSCTAPNIPTTCRVVFAQDFAPDDGAKDDHPKRHGTNVSGIVAGVAPDAKIAGLDVFFGVDASGEPTANPDDIVKAIDWVIANKQKYNIVAMNLSLGSSDPLFPTGHGKTCFSSYASLPFAKARRVNVISVVATGNDGFTNGISEPACALNAVRVGAVYDFTGNYASKTCTDSAVPDRVTCFSNSSRGMVTLLAPGSQITAAGITQSGTSQATPHVAGAVAVLRAADAFPGDTIDDTINRLVSNGDPITDTRNGVVVPRLNVGAVFSTEYAIFTQKFMTPILPYLLFE